MSDIYTIFSTEKDFYEKDEPVYIMELVNLTTGRDLDDEEHILYVNGEFLGESKIGKRMIARDKAPLEEIAEDTGLTLNKIQELSVKI